MKENETFSRYEFKYLLNNNLSKLIEDEAKHFMSLDDFANKLPSKSYFVRSLYFDNRSFTNFFEKVDGIKTRRKYRLRTYSKKLEDNSPIYLETKGRNLERTFKKRVKINKKETNYFIDPSVNTELIKKYPQNELINNFVFDTMKKNLIPTVLIDYNRKPYVNNHGLYFRLTFDSQLRSSRSNKLFLNNNMTLECNSGYTILEVKFHRSIPAWFHRIIQCYNLRRRSISKFVIGICSCKLESETSD